LVLTGPDGAGHTARLRYVADSASDAAVVWIRGLPGAERLPFAGLRQLGPPPLTAARAAEGSEAPGGRLATALGLAVPIPGAPPHDPAAIGPALRDLLAAASRTRPIFVLLDDADQVDEASVAAVLGAARHLRHERGGVLVVAADGDGSAGA